MPKPAGSNPLAPADPLSANLAEKVDTEMKQRSIMLALLLGAGLLVLAAGGAAVKSGANPAIVGGLEVLAIVLVLTAGIVVRVRTKA